MISAKRLSQLLGIWQTEWEKSPGNVPFTKEVDRAIAKLGHDLSAFTLKMEIARISGIPAKKRTPTENSVIAFYNRVKNFQEVSIQESLMTDVRGQIFLAKATHGYQETNKTIIEGQMSLEDAIGVQSNG